MPRNPAFVVSADHPSEVTEPSLELSTQVNVNIALMRWQISYGDVSFRL